MHTSRAVRPALPLLQSYYDWLSWPVRGVEELDRRQKAVKGIALERQSRLFFAGEATHKDDSYTVQGAYLSGITRPAQQAGWAASAVQAQAVWPAGSPHDLQLCSLAVHLPGACKHARCLGWLLCSS